MECLAVDVGREARSRYVMLTEPDIKWLSNYRIDIYPDNFYFLVPVWRYSQWLIRIPKWQSTDVSIDTNFPIITPDILDTYSAGTPGQRRAVSSRKA